MEQKLVNLLFAMTRRIDLYAQTHTVSLSVSLSCHLVKCGQVSLPSTLFLILLFPYSVSTVPVDGGCYEEECYCYRYISRDALIAVGSMTVMVLVGALVFLVVNTVFRNNK